MSDRYSSRDLRCLEFVPWKPHSVSVRCVSGSQKTCVCLSVSKDGGRRSSEERVNSLSHKVNDVDDF